MKRLTERQKKDLFKAGNLIVESKKDTICNALAEIVSDPTEKNITDWQLTEEAKMIRQIDSKSPFWWGVDTIGYYFDSSNARGARLIGIAMMLTMPDEIIEHKCVKPSKSKK